jgi:hypothetical protein
VCQDAKSLSSSPKSRYPTAFDGGREPGRLTFSGVVDGHVFPDYTLSLLPSREIARSTTAIYPAELQWSCAAHSCEVGGWQGVKAPQHDACFQIHTHRVVEGRKLQHPAALPTGLKNRVRSPDKIALLPATVEWCPLQHPTAFRNSLLSRSFEGLSHKLPLSAGISCRGGQSGAFSGRNTALLP